MQVFYHCTIYPSPQTSGSFILIKFSPLFMELSLSCDCPVTTVPWKQVTCLLVFTHVSSVSGLAISRGFLIPDSDNQKRFAILFRKDPVSKTKPKKMEEGGQTVPENPEKQHLRVQSDLNTHIQHVCTCAYTHTMCIKETLHMVGGHINKHNHYRLYISKDK